MLKAEESRRTFDLQQYGEKIIVKLMDESREAADAQDESEEGKGKGKELSFKQLLKGRGMAGDRFEVSRTFAAMLQLINNRNVAVVRDTHVEASSGTSHKAGAGVGKGGRFGSSSDSSLNTQAPDAPFRLRLLTAVQPHKQMASKMAVRGGGGAVETDGHRDEDCVEEEGEAVEEKVIVEGPRQQKKVKKVVAKAASKEESEEEDAENVEAEKDASPALKKSKTKGGENSKGSKASTRPLGRTQLKA